MTGNKEKVLEKTGTFYACCIGVTSKKTLFTKNHEKSEQSFKAKLKQRKNNIQVIILFHESEQSQT